MKIRKNDKVKVISGKDKGRSAVVEHVYEKSKTVLLPGLNLYKKHIKKNDKMPKGGIVELPRPLAVAKVMLVCPKCNKATRVGYRTEKNRKRRVCRQCDSVI
ncbi:50S ribosomal protein L24 [Patescibacteria group bacterium]|nr:50S ribosomal protein L24 [Patescibacteria group bacterium]MCL5091679.1 50S ribosomal protein L24 [Patescibacteria group bacterium]